MGIAEDIKAAIDKKLEDEQEDGMRAHLGASIIGRMCMRELFYTFRWANQKRHNGRMLRLFERGHLEETRFEEWIASVSEKFWATDPRTKEQIRVSDLFGYFGGSLDGVARNPLVYKGDYLVELKTHSVKSFNKLVLKGVKESKPEHYMQMQIYLKYKPKLEGALYFAICKNDDDLYIEYVERDEATANEGVEKAQVIISATEPPAPHPSASPFNYYCKHFCDHNVVCEFADGRQPPKETCRSCAHVVLTEEGWMCDNDDSDHRMLDVEQQKKGCECYERGF